MSRSVNKVTLIGTVGKDPEARYTPSGSQVVSLSVATNESYNDKNTGQRVENTEWHRIVAFGKLAEIILQYVKKGSKLYLEGKLKTTEWEKDGIKRYNTDIVANEMVMLDGAPKHDQGYPQMNQGVQQQGNQYHQQQQPQGYGQQSQGYGQTQQQTNQVYQQANNQPQQQPQRQQAQQGQQQYQAQANPHNQQQPQNSFPSGDGFDLDIPF